MGKRAVVIGATGLVGKAVVEKLVASEAVDEIVTLTRRAVEYASPKVQNRVVDFEKLEEADFGMTGDWMFSCLGTTRKQAGSIEAQRRVDFDYQLRAAEFAAKQGIRHYLLVSSAGADEKSNNPYLRMKGELDQRVQTLGFSRISIFRPSLLLGERPQMRMGEKLGSWILPLLCRLPGLRPYRPITGEQVATKMFLVSQSSGPSFECFALDQVFP